MYNKVIMIGRLTAKPEMVKTPTDKSVTRATVAVNRRFKGSNGEREADFINVVMWGRLAETLASYGTKGSLISIDGELRTRKYEKDGQTHYITEVLASSFQLLESRAQRAMRENNVSGDLSDLVLEEEELPLLNKITLKISFLNILVAFHRKQPFFIENRKANDYNKGDRKQV